MTFQPPGPVPTTPGIGGGGGGGDVPVWQVSASVATLRSNGSPYYNFTGDGTTMTITVPGCIINTDHAEWSIIETTTNEHVLGWRAGPASNQFTGPTVDGQTYRITAMGELH